MKATPGLRKRDRLRARLKRRGRAAPEAAGSRPGHWADPLEATGVENLHRIAPTLYRSAQPRRADVAALQALGIRSVVSLRSFNDDAEVFRGVDGIALVRVAIDTWAIDDAKVLRALTAIDAALKRGPVLIHCLHGADRTGVVSAAYRMAVQGWSKEAAREEMLRGGYGYHTLWRNIPRYLDRFDPASMRRALEQAIGGALKPSA
jgi:protein tyrosine phosphatase (PTP) superfamily phosphohydrolase (DUF442 family)